MKKRVMFTVISLALAMVSVLPVHANRLGLQAPAQEITKEEAALYKSYYDVRTDPAKAYPLAKEYLSKYPNGRYADYVKTKGIPQARGALFTAAATAKNVPEMLKYGKEALADNPDDLDYLYLMAYHLRQLELFASPPKLDHSADAADFSKRAIKLIEGGKVPTVVAKDKWNQNLVLASLYQNIAVIEASNKNVDGALQSYKKAAELDPVNSFNYLACGSLYQAKYAEAVKKFQEVPEAERTAAEPKPEVKAKLDEVNKHADEVINCWARFMALTAADNPYGPQRDQIKKILDDLYKYRHPDSPDGLEKLIEQYRSSNPPASGTRSGSSD